MSSESYRKYLLDIKLIFCYIQIGFRTNSDRVPGRSFLCQKNKLYRYNNVGLNSSRSTMGR